MAVNRPSLRTQPEDKVGLRRHKSMATGLQVLYIPSDWSTVWRRAKPSIATVAVLASKQIEASRKWLAVPSTVSPFDLK